ncbi:hypothetical protein CsSME_00051607 [Camellia sinensis var. sinensis]
MGMNMNPTRHIDAATKNPAGGANTTAIGLNPRSTDAVYPSDVDIIGAALNPMHNTNAGVGDRGGAPTSSYGTSETVPTGLSCLFPTCIAWQRSALFPVLSTVMPLPVRFGVQPPSSGMRCKLGVTVSLMDFFGFSVRDVYSPRFCVLGFGYLFCCRGAVCAIEAEWTWTNVCPDDFAGGSWFTMLAMVDSHLYDPSPNEVQSAAPPLHLLALQGFYLPTPSTYLSISFIQMLKALMPVAVYSIGIIFRKDSFNSNTMANMLFISFDVVIAAYGEAKFDS